MIKRDKLDEIQQVFTRLDTLDKSRTVTDNLEDSYGNVMLARSGCSSITLRSLIPPDDYKDVVDFIKVKLDKQRVAYTAELDKYVIAKAL